MKGMIYRIDKIFYIQEDQLRTCATQREEADHENEGCHSIFSDMLRTRSMPAIFLGLVFLGCLLSSYAHIGQQDWNYKRLTTHYIQLNRSDCVLLSCQPHYEEHF
jgi:hypothetical protein